MKKICLLFSIIICCLSGFAQEFNVSPSTVESGAAVTVTGTGETSEAYFCSVQWDPTLITYSDGTPRSWITTKPFSDISFKDVFGTKPTSFKMIITNSHTLEDFTVTLGIRTNICSTTPGTPTRTNVIKYITVTVKHIPTQTIFYNDAKSQVFYRNNCGSGFASDPYAYSVPANKYSAPTKTEANNKAQAEINANGQNTANATLTCKQVYYNAEISGSFTRNDCGPGRAGSVVNYIIAAKKYHSFSQIEADQLAAADLTSNGQSYANTTGMCTEVRKRYRAVLRGTDPCSSSGEVGSLVWIRNDLDLNKVYSQGNSRVFLYTSADGTTKVPEGNYKIMYMIDNTGEQGNRIFSVNYDGEIVGFALCQQ